MTRDPRRPHQDLAADARLLRIAWLVLFQSGKKVIPFSCETAPFVLTSSSCTLRASVEVLFWSS